MEAMPEPAGGAGSGPSERLHGSDMVLIPVSPLCVSELIWLRTGKMVLDNTF